MFVSGALEPAAALQHRAMATALWPILPLQPEGTNESETKHGKTTKKKGRETGQQPTTEEETGSKGAPLAAPSPVDPGNNNLCERVMHPARINVSSITKQGLCNVSSRSRKGIWVNPLSQGTYVKLNRCCNCMMYHEFLIVNILL